MVADNQFAGTFDRNEPALKGRAIDDGKVTSL
jgi:hypothetical protein